MASRMQQLSFRTHLIRLWKSRYAAWVRHARQGTASKADAEDAVQAAARDCLQVDPEVKDQKHANAYMYVAIRSKARPRRRRSNPGGAAGTIPWVRRKPVEPSAPSPLDIALRAEGDEEDRRLRELAKRALEKLDPELREAVDLVVLREPKLPLRAVAKIQGVSVSTVHRRVQRALDSLRNIDMAIGGSPAENNDDDTG